MGWVEPTPQINEAYFYLHDLVDGWEHEVESSEYVSLAMARSMIRFIREYVAKDYCVMHGFE